MITEEQYNFCNKEANILAKQMMNKDVSKVFGKEGGNANFVLNTLVYLCAGSLYLISEQIEIDHKELLRIFAERIESIIVDKHPKSKINMTIN